MDSEVDYLLQCIKIPPHTFCIIAAILLVTVSPTVPTKAGKINAIVVFQGMCLVVYWFILFMIHA